MSKWRVSFFFCKFTVSSKGIIKQAVSNFGLSYVESFKLLDAWVEKEANLIKSTEAQPERNSG